ncbi:hypothetical protein Tco_0092411 [Tanacetum coccineum]
MSPRLREEWYRCLSWDGYPSCSTMYCGGGTGVGTLLWVSRAAVADPQLDTSSLALQWHKLRYYGSDIVISDLEEFHSLLLAIGSIVHLRAFRHQHKLCVNGNRKGDQSSTPLYSVRVWRTDDVRILRDPTDYPTDRDDATEVEDEPFGYEADE